MTVLTFGHGTADQNQLTALLRGADVGLVVDVRRFPGSRRHPHTATELLREWLPAEGVAYRWDQRLGGRRTLAPDQQGMDPWWQVKAFRAYAAHMRTEEFRTALGDLLDDLDAPPATSQSVALMCSETLWWRCHRRMIADTLVLLHRVPVAHLGHDGGLTRHVAAAGARVTGAGLRYDQSA